jgi:hypothetical protein
VVFLIIIIILYFVLSKKQTVEKILTPYKLNGSLFTPAERSFYGIVNRAEREE